MAIFSSAWRDDHCGDCDPMVGVRAGGDLPRRRVTGPTVVVSLMAVISVACGSDGAGDERSGPDVARGEQLYARGCASCHGEDLRGTAEGPSHLSRVYEQSHHGDDAFRSAARNGSLAHHWRFGDMPPVRGLSDADIDDVIAYIRSEQERQGFEPYPPP